MSDHEHDEEGNCITPENPLYPDGMPTWRFSLWDISGLVLNTVGNLLQATGLGVNGIARECAAMANWSRKRFDAKEAHQAAMAEWEYEEAARREMAETYERLTGIDTLWLEQEEGQS